LLLSKNVPIPPFNRRVEDIDYHLWYGEAVRLLTTAEGALDSMVTLWMELANTGTWKPEDDLRMSSVAFEVMYGLAWGAIQKIFRSAGSSQVRRGQRMERVWRDYSQLFSHGHSFLPNQIARNYTKAKFGVESAATGYSPAFKSEKV
jgi:3-hydroxy-9,10-secoandrosta-1,3,5(10)-triene-9,17-dione monooxygenase